MKLPKPFSDTGGGLALRRLRRALGAVAGCAVLVLAAGCSILPASAPLEVHVLPVGERMAAPAGGVPWSLRVATPTAGAGLAGNRIAVMPEPHRLAVYQGVRWSDPVPVLLRDRLIEAFRIDARVSAVASDQSALPTDLALEGDLGAFQSEYQGGVPVVRVRLDLRLVHRDSLKIVSSRRFEAREAVAGVEVPQVVSAFGRAADRLADEVVDWVIAQGGPGGEDDATACPESGPEACVEGRKRIVPDLRDPALDAVRWTLLRVGEHVVSAGTRPAYLEFARAPQPRVSGSSGCNRLTGGFSLDGAQLRFLQVAGTRMMCPDGMALEQAFLNALAATRNHRIGEGRLWLLDERGEVLAELAAPSPR